MKKGGFRFLADSAPPVRRFSACPCFTALFRAPRSKNTTENHTPPRRRKRPPFDRAPRLSIRQAVANIEHAAPPDSGKPSAVRPRRRKRPPWRPCAASGLSAIPATSERRHHRQAVRLSAIPATSERRHHRQAVRLSAVRPWRPCADSGKWTANKNAAPVRPRRRIRRQSATIAGNAA